MEKKHHIYISVVTLYSVLCWSTFGSDYSLESFGMMLQAWHTCIWAVSPIPLCRSSQALSGWMWSVAAQLFSGLQRCLIGFKSGLWLGHSRTLRDLSRGHPYVVLALCLGSLSCWKDNNPFAPVWGPERSGAGFHQGSLCTLLCSSVPRSWQVSQSLLLKNIPTA